MRASLPKPAVCLVTDRRRTLGRSVASVVSSALDGQVNVVQLREKDLPANELLTLAQELRELTAGRALFFVNDRVDVALAAGADGVQLGEYALPVEAVRELGGDRLLVGRSVHDIAGAVAAEASGADFLIAGTVFPSSSHPRREAAGVDLLEDLKTALEIPYLAIGGITSYNVAQAIDAGASGAAVISAISESGEVEAATRQLTAAVDSAWRLAKTDLAGRTT